MADSEKVIRAGALYDTIKEGTLAVIVHELMDKKDMEPEEATSFATYLLDRLIASGAVKELERARVDYNLAVQEQNR